ncbi:MAG: U32 family peptidase [Deltaproteobacteria bacterium]|nr:U32 family peptidase [Deltaproteobacteria bacterium]
MEISIGPVLFEWKREDLIRFYEEVSEMDVDTVYIGEVVCSKKKGLKPNDIGAVAKMLEEAGKKAVISTLAVVSNEEELGLTRSLLKLPYAVEANDMSVFNMIEKGRAVYAGPHITAYNALSIEFLQSVGVSRVVFPVELSKDSIAYNIRQTGIEGEVFGHGNVPLAFSWRCYTSRAYGLTKTGCRGHCALHPDGMEIKAIEGGPLFNLNGTSILSASVYSLVEVVDEIKNIGAAAIRISPSLKGTGKAVQVFRKRMSKVIGPEEALLELKDALGHGALSNGWFYGKAGKDYIRSEAGSRACI